MLDAIQSVLFSHAKSLLGFAIFFSLLEFIFPAKKNQMLVRKDTKLDLAYSFLLTTLYFPAQIFGSLFVGLYFYGAVGMPEGRTTQPITVTILQKASQGKVVILKNGAIQYQPGPGYTGFDYFIIQKSDGENNLVQTIMAKSANEVQKLDGILSENNHKQVSLFVTSSASSGNIAQGFTGWFLNARTLILGQSLWIQIFLAILVVDFAGYWRHRLMHSKFLWPFHTIHHSSQEVDWLSTERFHPVNHYITAILNLIILTALFSDPYVSATAMSLRRKYGLFIHSNVRISYGFLNFIIVSPLFHRWHHSDNPVAFNRNYSTFFSFFDLFFGTFYLPKDKKDPDSFGFYGGVLKKEWVAQLIYPFLKRKETNIKT
jgi:sterol desaturase/sphingolipid hydroxylase (fatty acid hydroxylase superfamily)